MKNLKKLVCLVLAMMILTSAFTFVTQAESKSNVSVKVEKYITEAIYEEVGVFSDGYAAVKRDGKWGYIDETGKEVVKPRFAYAWKFSDGIAFVGDFIEGSDLYRLNYINESMFEKVNNGEELANFFRWSVINFEGIGIGSSTFGADDVPEITYCENAVVIDDIPYKIQNAKPTLITVNNYESLFETPYDEYSGKYNYAFVDTNIVNGLISMYAWIYTGEIQQPKKCFLMDYEGNIIKQYPINYSSVIKVSEVDWQSGNYTAPKEYSIVQVTYGKDVSVANYGYFVIHGDAMHWVAVGLGIIDDSGKWLTKNEFNNFYWYSNHDVFFGDVLVARDSSGKWGVLDKLGETLIDYQYDDLGMYKGGYFWAEKDGEVFYIDINNTRYDIPAISGGIIMNNLICSNFADTGYARIKDKTLGKYYIITDKSDDGKLAIVDGSDEIDLDGVFLNINSGITSYEKNGKKGFMKLSFTEVENEPETPEESTVKGDINGDGKFNYSDVSKLYAYFRKKLDVPEDADFDINGDGKFNYSDVSKLYAIFRKKADFN